MTRHRRARALSLALALGLSPLLLSGCGGSETPEAESYLVTDLTGGTASPGAIPAPDPTATTDSSSGALSGDDLVALIGAAAGDFDSVRVTQGNATPPADIEAEVTYGDADDFVAQVFTGPNQPATVITRVDGALYVGSEDQAGKRVPAGQLSPGSGGALPNFFAWNPLLDLRAALEGAQGLEQGGPATLDGEDVTSYTFTLDLDELPRPSLIVPDAVSGDADVVVSLGADDLPVQLELVFEGVAGETTVVLSYSDWGGPDDIAVPSGS